jgi:cysteine-rich repeat protein
MFPVISAFSADRTSVAPGESVTLSYMVTEADTVQIDPGVLSSSSMLSGSVSTPALAASTSFTLRAKSAVGETTRTVAITVRTSTGVEITKFEAEPKVIAPGGTTRLSWTTVDATRVQLLVEGGAVLDADAPKEGMRDVQPSENTTYVLLAEGPGGQVTRMQRVLVGFQPEIPSFEANPPQITLGQSTTLSWTVVNAESIMLRDDMGNAVVPNAMAEGSRSVSPQVTTTYELVASGRAGDAVKRVTIEVLPPGSARIVRFLVAPTSLPGPGEVNIDWETADADTIDLTADGISVMTFPRTPSGNISLSLAATTVLALRVENDVGMAEEVELVTVGTPDLTAPSIQHVPLAPSQLEGTAMEIGATILDVESGVAAATLFYRTVGMPAFQSVAMLTSGNDRYSAEIPGALVAIPGVEYYIHAGDMASPANIATNPASAPADVHSFTVVALDVTGPMITHTPIANDQLDGSAIAVSAQVSDASGVGSVQLFYKRRADSTYTTASMTGAAGTYTANIPAAVIVPPGVDYYIEANDAAVPANSTRFPATAPATPQTFSVILRDLQAPSIVHTVITNGQISGLAVTVNADVSDATGVGAVTLYYRTSGGGAYSSAAMTVSGSLRTAQIPGNAVVSPGVDYYLEAVDTAMPVNTGRLPAAAPGAPYSFTVTPADTAAPTITHTPITNEQASGVAVTIQATVIDGTGVSVATLYYRAMGAGTYSQVAMTGGPQYTATIPASSVTSVGVEYYLGAVDSSPTMSASVLPASAPAQGFRFAVGRAEAEPNGTAATATPLLGPGVLANIGLGSISPSADRDYWIVDVPAGTDRYTVRFEITAGGPGLCPSPNDSYLTLYAADGTTVLLGDDNDGVGSCARIDPVTDTAARALAAGRYFIRVQEDGDNATIPAYEIRASMELAACGNNILELAATEQCDDGNTNNGDGCSEVCRLEAEGTASAPGAVFSGDISPAGDVDLYSVTVTQGQFLRAELSNGAGGCPGDTVLELISTDGNTTLGTDDNDGPGSCSLINPLTDSFAANMAAGTYFLRVRAFNAGTVLTGYSLDIDITSNLCGNNAVENGETCDDGDSISNDGCSSSCQLELQATVTGNGGSYMQGIDPVGNIDWYAIVVPAGASLRVETFVPADGTCTAGQDTVIRLYAPDRTTQLATDDESGLASCSLLDPIVDTDVRNLAAGTYYLTIEDWLSDDVITAYVVDIEIRMPVCGDGFVGGTEACDDGGTMNGDGCSSGCLYEGPAEAEPNNTTGTATPFLTGGLTTGRMIGALASSSDVDMYTVVVPAGGGHILGEITNGRGGCPGSLTLRLRSSTGSTLSTDTADGPGSCGRISPGGDSAARNLAAGTYYLEVTGASSVATYILDARVMASGCGDLYLVSGEQCDDGNTNAGDGCSPMCQLELNELEPNNTSSTAMVLSGPSVTVGGRINVAGEDDWFAIDVAQGGSLHVAVHNGGPDQCGSIDPDLEVFAPNMMMSLAEDDLDGQGNCAVLYRSELWNLAAGRYYVKLDGFSSTATFNYVFSAAVFGP